MIVTPKEDTILAIGRLTENPDFRKLTEWLQESLDSISSDLINVKPEQHDSIFLLIGEARGIKDILKRVRQCHEVRRTKNAT
jgi:hypothetical protein